MYQQLKLNEEVADWIYASSDFDIIAQPYGNDKTVQTNMQSDMDSCLVMDIDLSSYSPQ